MWESRKRKISEGPGVEGSAEEERPNAGGFGEAPPQTQSSVPTWGGQGHLCGLWDAAMRLGAAPAAGPRRPGSGDGRSGWFGGGCVRIFFALAI